MKASELRIGNLCQDKISGALLKVTGLKENDISFYVIDRNLFPLQPGWQAEPIPLTEEWLLKFGFEFYVDTWYLKGFALWETEWGDDKGNTGIGYFYELRQHGMMDKHIKYIHQLQNLYFALTEDNLKFKSE